MTDISRHPLLRQAYELSLAIERIPIACTEQTDACVKASELSTAIDRHLDAPSGSLMISRDDVSNLRDRAKDLAMFHGQPEDLSELADRIAKALGQREWIIIRPSES